MAASLSRLSAACGRAADWALGPVSLRPSSVYGRVKTCADGCLRFYTADFSSINKLSKLPIGISSFQTIMGRNQAYVDKTLLIYKLISNAPERLTVSAPRRFGKSLLLDTVAEVFRGNRELFRGCDIYNSDFQWDEYAVMKLDLSDIDSTTPEVFSSSLQANLVEIAKQSHIDIDEQADKNIVMKRLLRGLQENHNSREVVVLIDEADAPVVKHLTGSTACERTAALVAREVKNLFTILKANDKHLRFVLAAGVHPLSNIISSSGSNLTDISGERGYETLFGYTEQEIKRYLGAHVHAIAGETNRTEAEIYNAMRSWYNGYKFHPEQEPIYNPWSVLQYLRKNGIPGDYWSNVGTPTFAIEVLLKNASLYPHLIQEASGSGYKVDQYILTRRHDPETLIKSPAALLYQSGYLTIRDYDAETEEYSLVFPNYEVKQAFVKQLLPQLTDKGGELARRAQYHMMQGLDRGEVNAFIESLATLTAGIPHRLLEGQKNESYYHTVIYVALLPFRQLRVTPEEQTSQGSTDLVIETRKHVYLIELKHGDKSSAKAAIDQVISKGYWRKYAHHGKEIIGIGLNFSSRKELSSTWYLARLQDGEMVPHKRVRT